MTDSPPIVMVFAATHPTGGAGLQADIMTLASMGCHPVSVVTAITVQDTMGVDGVLPIDGEWVSDQARCILEDMPVAAFKIGVLGSVENVLAVAEITSDYPEIPLIFDPVLTSGCWVGIHSLLILPHTSTIENTFVRGERKSDGFRSPPGRVARPAIGPVRLSNLSKSEKEKYLLTNVPRLLTAAWMPGDTSKIYESILRNNGQKGHLSTQRGT